jgi:glycosyltransferase involved in cell wall biosynthesis
VRILVVHQYYLFPGQPGGSRFNELARLWSASGHEVEVIAGTVNYATGEAADKYSHRWVTREADGPVRVLRCHVPTTYNSGYVGRSWAFAGFTLSACTAVLLASRPDIVVGSSPPLTVALPARLASIVYRVPWVFEVRDLWPESAVSTGVLAENSLMTRLLYRLERWAYRKSSLINVLTPAFKENLLRRTDLPNAKIFCVPNGADVSLFSPGDRDNAFRKASGWGQRTVALYAGAHGRANAVGQLVDAADLLRDRPDILIAAVGDGPERAHWQSEVERRGLTNIQFLGPQPKQLMNEIVTAADIGLAVLQKNPTFLTVYPNKVFDYMACERPIVLAIDGAARRLVCDEAQAGVAATPEMPSSLANAIASLADDKQRRNQLGRNGRAWVLENATREMLASSYLTHLERLVKSNRRKPIEADDSVPE